MTETNTPRPGQSDVKLPTSFRVCSDCPTTDECMTRGCIRSWGRDERQNAEGGVLAVEGPIAPAATNGGELVSLPATLSLIERLAVDPRVGVDTLERMFALQERLIANDARARFNEAMNAAQREIQPVARTAENKAVSPSSFYAKLEAIDAVIRPIYLHHGFSLRYDNVPPIVAGNIRIECQVAHTAGHIERYGREAPPDTHGPKGAPVSTPLHGQAKTETFLKRYLTCGIFNVVFKDMDNDGNGALSQDQIDYIRDLAQQVRGGEPRFLKFMKVEKVEDISARQYRKAVSALEEQIAKEKANDAG